MGILLHIGITLVTSFYFDRIRRVGKNKNENINPR
jgi:hypothetical protein